MIALLALLFACSTSAPQPAIDCAHEPGTPRCPPDSSPECGAQWKKVEVWHAACPAKIDCSQEPALPRCPEGSSTGCDAAWATVRAYQSACEEPSVD